MIKFNEIVSVNNINLIDTPVFTEVEESSIFPDEIILNIFSFLSHEDLRLTTSLVCRKWNVLSFDKELWKNFPCFHMICTNFSVKGVYYKYCERENVHKLSMQKFIEGLKNKNLPQPTKTLVSCAKSNNSVRVSFLNATHNFCYTDESGNLVTNKTKHTVKIELDYICKEFESLNLKETSLSYQVNYSLMYEVINGFTVCEISDSLPPDANLSFATNCSNFLNHQLNSYIYLIVRQNLKIFEEFIKGKEAYASITGKMDFNKNFVYNVSLNDYFSKTEKEVLFVCPQITKKTTSYGLLRTVILNKTYNEFYKNQKKDLYESLDKMNGDISIRNAKGDIINNFGWGYLPCR